MRRYINAYELQQRDGLTRQEILELAKIGPIFLKNPRFGSYPSYDKREYCENGFATMKKIVTTDWCHLASKFEEIPKERWNEVIYERFPDIINGEIAYKLLGSFCPQEIQKNLNSSYTMRQIISMMDGGYMINLFEIPDQWYINKKTIWNYLSRIPNTAVDLYFERIFQEDLFFDRDEMPGVATSVSHSLAPPQPTPLNDSISAETILREPSQADPITDKIKIASLIKKALETRHGLTGPERRYCTALIERLNGQTFENSFKTAYPTTTNTDQRNLNKQGREYCTKAHKVARTKMGINFDLSLITGKI